MSERRLQSVSEVESLPSPPWLIERTLPQAALAMLWGESNVGKSFVALDIAASVAIGNSWFKKPTTKGRVVYVAAEGVYSFKRRIRAWRQYNCVAPEDLDNLSFAGWSLQLHKEEAVNELLRMLREDKPALVVIDTLAASALGVNEDKVDGIGPVLDSLLRLRARLQATILVVHHTGWLDPDKKKKAHERGSSAYRGAMDTSIQVLPGELTCEKQRDHERFKPLKFTLEEETWGSNWDDESLVVVPR